MEKHFIRIVHDDIFNIKADALVYSANTRPCPAEYGLDLQVWKRAGMKNMFADRDGRVFEIGHLHISRAFDLSDHFKWIFHVVTPLFMGGSYYEEDILCECYKKCLRKANELKLNSIAFPVLASGFLNFNMYDAFDIAQQAIDEIAPKLREMDIMIVELTRSWADDYDKLANFTREYVDRKMEEMIAAGELDNLEERADVLTQGEEILANYEVARKEIEKHRSTRLIYRQVKEERKRYLSDETKTDKEFSHEMIAKIINEWCDEPNDEYTGNKYEREKRSPSMLAGITGLDKKTLTSMAVISGKSVPKRQTLLAVAVAMKLPKEKRLRFMLYADPKKEYPSSTYEETLEIIIEKIGIKAGYKQISDEYYKEVGTSLLPSKEKPDKEKEK